MQKMHNYFFNNEIFDFFRNSFSLITDPLPRMSFFVFLGTLFFSYFVYMFFRRFENRYFGDHFDDEDDAYENFIGSAITTSIELNVLCVNLIRFGNILDSSADNYPPYEIVLS